MNAVAGEKDQLVALVEASKNLDFRFACASGLDRADMRSSFTHDKRGPFIPLAKERACRDFDNIVRLPNRNSRLNSKTVSQARSLRDRGEDVGNHVDTLFFDAQG